MEPRCLTLEQQEKQWLFSEADFARTPSIQIGILAQQEASKRAKGCRFITDVAERLRLGLETTATARLFFQRFYMRLPFPRKENEEPHPFMIGATALQMACKLTDNYRRLNDLIYHCRVCSRADFQKGHQITKFQPTDKEAVNWKDGLLYYENELCKTLEFDFAVKLPFGHAISLFEKGTAETVRMFDNMKHSDFLIYQQFSRVHRKLKLSLLKLSDDCMSTTLALRYPCEKVALIILYAVASMCNVWLQKQDSVPPAIRRFAEMPFQLQGRSIFEMDPFAGRVGPPIFTTAEFEGLSYEILIAGARDRSNVEKHALLKYGKASVGVLQGLGTSPNPVYDKPNFSTNLGVWNATYPFTRQNQS
ncbi:hypothetical protein HDU97_008498 [Phlyctochytrium planicorne]|nr:hypothetical protein HDU97_008498 [Phlyctochytrium planicorne]